MDHMDAPGPNDGPFGGNPNADDDDHFDLQFTPADPTINALTALLEPAYVRVLAVPGEHDTHNTMDFKHYKGNSTIPSGLRASRRRATTARTLYSRKRSATSGPSRKLSIHRW